MDPDAGRPPPLAGVASWDPEGLALSPEATAKVIRRRMSASSAAAIRSCAARWAIEKLLPRSEHPFGAAELGTATHQLFEDLFARPKGRRGIEDAMRILDSLDVMHGAKLPAPDDPAELESWRGEIERRMVGLWNLEDPDGIDVVAREMTLTTKVDRVPFTGFIDRVSLVPGGVQIADYKAGKGKVKAPSRRFGDPHGDQLRLYAMALANQAPEMVDGDPTRFAARVLYVYHAKALEVDLSPRALGRTAAGLRRSWDDQTEMALTRVFPTVTSPLCGWCPAVEVCPAATKAGLGPRDPAALGGAGLGIEALPAASTSPGTPPSYIPADHDDPEEADMTVKHEGKSWEETTPNTADLNPNSFAAVAAFGLSAMAVECLHGAGVAVSPRNVKALAATFATLVASAESALGYRPGFQSGLHTRLRGALHTCLVTIPPPFGDDAEAWDEWAAATSRRMLAIAKTAFGLWEASSADDPDPAPWRALATTKLAVVEGGGR